MIPAELFCVSCGAKNMSSSIYCAVCNQLLVKPLQRTQTGLLPPNHLLKQRYRILSSVGEGGFGAVYKAEDTLTGNQTVAVKEMSQKDLRDQKELAEAAEAFKHEADMLKKLSHPNLPKIRDYFDDTGRWYLVMDFIEGETLEHYLEQAPNKKLPIPEVLKIGIQLCTILDYLHTRQPPIIFRDLNSKNIMCTPAGHLYLIDFGIARYFKHGQMKDTTPLGTKGYAAPEQYGRSQTEARSDIYSLGAVLHEVLSGNDPSTNISPFHFLPLHSYDPSIPPQLEQLIMRMLEIQIHKRPASMADIKKQLEAIASHPPTSPPPVYRSRATLHVFKRHKGQVYSVAWSSDSGYLASASEDRTVCLWNVATRDFDTSYDYARPVKVVVWLYIYNGIYLAAMTTDQVVHVRNNLTGDITLYKGHAALGRGYVFSLAWSPNSRYIASAGDSNRVFVWDTISGSDVKSYHGSEAWITAVAWSPDGSYIASGDIDGTMRVWDAISDANILAYDGLPGEVCALAWSPDSKYFVSASGNQVQIWDALTKNKPLATYTHHKGVNAVAWSPDGKYIASAGNDETVQIWEVSTQQNIFNYLEHRAPVRDVSWSPNGRYLASADEDRLIYLWEVK